MNRKQIATTSVSIHATDSTVWEVLTKPDHIREYMFGTETSSDWAIGNPVIFTGIWEGVTYHDRGIVLENNPLRTLSYSYWSPLSGTEDFEDNYSHITHHLSPFHDETVLTITQDNLESDEEVAKAESNWILIGQKIKARAESLQKNDLNRGVQDLFGNP
jgi:uncharacterized protein YndB with AHSA1/START domain